MEDGWRGEEQILPEGSAKVGSWKSCYGKLNIRLNNRLIDIGVYGGGCMGYRRGGERGREIIAFICAFYISSISCISVIQGKGSYMYFEKKKSFR